MRKIDFFKPIMTLKGESMKDSRDGKIMYINEVVANMLTVAKAKKSAIRQLKLAYAINDTKGPMDVEDDDLDTIKIVVKEAGSSTLIQGQIEELLEDKDPEKK